MLGVLVWIVVILLICFSVTGWHWIIFYVVILPFSTLLFFFYVDFPENHFNIKRFKNDIKYYSFCFILLCVLLPIRRTNRLVIHL